MNNNTLPKTPTLDKMQEIQDSSQICGQFLEWLQSKFAMFKLDTARNEPVYHGSGDYINIEETLAEFFDIDLSQAEKEKRELLKYLNQISMTNKGEKNDNK